MKNIKPCPYCNSEVEITRLPDKITHIQKTKRKVIEVREEQYRLQCTHCHALTAKGIKFDKETEEEGRERIKQYKDEIEKRYQKTGCGDWIVIKK